MGRTPAAGMQTRLPAPPLAPAWDHDDQQRLANFLSTPTGLALIARWQAVEYVNLQNAAADPMHSAHSAGRAFGFVEARQWLQSLSRSSRAPEEEHARQANGEPALSELYSP